MAGLGPTSGVCPINVSVKRDLTVVAYLLNVKMCIVDGEGVHVLYTST